MTRVADFFRWLGTPVRACRALFPFTHEGRQTLVYLVFAGAGPAITVFALWIMQTARDHGWNGIFADMADKVGYALLLIVTALGTFVAFRAISIGKDGIKAEAKDDEHPTITAKAEVTVEQPQ